MPGYKEHKSFEGYKSDVKEEKKKEGEMAKFDAPLPSSSVFERETSDLGFEMKAKVKPQANIHGSMLNIHAACEIEDDNIEELEKLRDVSPDADPVVFRQSDINLSAKPNQTSATSRPLGLHHMSHYTSMLSEAPPESPDLKTKYSVKDEIAQLRYRVSQKNLSLFKELTFSEKGYFFWDR